MGDLKEAVQLEFGLMEMTLARFPRPEELSHLAYLELSGVGALLQDIYMGFENIVKRVAQSRRLRLPDGASWHKDLLELAITQGIISEATGQQMVPLLGFRHFLAHRYAADLSVERLEPLVRTAPRAYESFKKDIEGHL